MAQDYNMNFGAFIGNAQGKMTFPAAYTGDTVTIAAQNGLTFTHATARLVPGATSFSLRNNANNADNLLVSNAGAVTVRAGLTVTAGGAVITAGGLTVTTGDSYFRGAPVISKRTSTDVDAQHNIFTVAQAVAGVVRHTSVTGAGTVTTDTAANYIAGSSSLGVLGANGDSYAVYYINDGDQTLTFAAGDANVTLGDAGQTIANNEAAILLLRRTSATAVTIDIVGA